MGSILVIDGNWFLMSRLWGIRDSIYQKKDASISCVERDSIFRESLMVSLTMLIDSYYDFFNFEDIIITYDSKSWRKSISITYKSSRAHARENMGLPFEEIFESWNNFLDTLHQIGNISNKRIWVRGGISEGDDQIWYIITHKHPQDSVLIASSDHDLHQLLGFDMETGSFIASADGGNHIYLPCTVPASIQESLRGDLPQIMGYDAFQYPFFASFISRCIIRNRTIIFCDPLRIILLKIFSGDSSDNIPAIFNSTAGGKNPKRMHHLSIREAGILLDLLELRSPIQILENPDTIAKKIISIIGTGNYLKRWNNKNIPGVSQLSEILLQNLHLVWLDSRTIPESIQESLGNIFGNDRFIFFPPPFPPA